MQIGGTMPVQFKVIEAKEQMVAGMKYYLTIEIHTTACPEGSPSAEDEAACRATHTQRCLVHVVARLHSDGGGHEIVDPQPSCTAKQTLPGKIILIFLVYVLKSDYVLAECGN